MSEVKESFEYYIEIQNDEGVTVDGIDDIFKLLFNKDDDTISNSLHIRGLRTSSNGGVNKSMICSMKIDSSYNDV